jgi:hypothetical protein
MTKVKQQGQISVLEWTGPYALVTPVELGQHSDGAKGRSFFNVASIGGKGSFHLDRNVNIKELR